MKGRGLFQTTGTTTFLRAGGSQYLDGWEDKKDKLSFFLRAGGSQYFDGIAVV